MFLWVCGGQRFAIVLFWFSDMSRLPCSSSRWWLMMFAELWRGADMKHSRASSQKPQLNLSCPCPGCLGYVQVVKWDSPGWERGCEKPCLIPSPGSHWGFHTFPSGHSSEHCYGNWALLTFWPNGLLSFTTTNLFCIIPDVQMSSSVWKERGDLVSCLCLNIDLTGNVFKIDISTVRIIASDKSCREWRSTLFSKLSPEILKFCISKLNV